MYIHNVGFLLIKKKHHTISSLDNSEKLDLVSLISNSCSFNNNNKSNKLILKILIKKTIRLYLFMYDRNIISTLRNLFLNQKQNPRKHNINYITFVTVKNKLINVIRYYKIDSVA